MSFRSTSAEVLVERLYDLLPPGRVWVKERTTRLFLFLYATAGELSRVHNKLASLIDEMDPRTTDELLENWEELAGLPEPCDPNPSTDPDIRRAILTAKLNALGGSSPSYLKGIADEATGEECTISEWGLDPFVAGSEAGDSLYSLEMWAHWWSVEIPNVDVEYFQAGEDAGDSLAVYPSEVSQLACILNRIKPAQTRFFFEFPDDDLNT